MVRAWLAGVAVLAGMTVPLAVATPAAAQTGTFAYVTNISSDSVSVIDTVTNTVATTIPVGDFPHGVEVTPDGARVYVANIGSNSVSVIDTATNTVATTIPVGNGPIGVAVAPDGSRVYVTNFKSDNVSVIDTVTNTVITTIPVGDVPNGVAVARDGTRVYVTNAGSDNVSVIDTATNTLITTVPVGDNPGEVAIGTVVAERTPTRLTLRLEKKKGKEGLEALGGGGRDGLTLKARLTAEGEPLAGKPIEFTTDSVSLCTETTDSRGKATCKVPRSRADETCYTATFAGDDTYEPSTATFCRFNGRSGQPSELEGLEGLSFIPAQALTPAART